MTRSTANSRALRALMALTAALALLATMLSVSPAQSEAQAAESVTIMDIQGEGHISPLVGETVTTDGIVTAVSFSGFYMQDRAGDDNDATSDGIFVFPGGDSKPAIGDKVRVTGSVSEFIPGGPATGNLSITQLSGDFEVLASGRALPRPVEDRTPRPHAELRGRDQRLRAADQPADRPGRSSTRTATRSTSTRASRACTSRSIARSPRRRSASSARSRRSSSRCRATAAR